MKYKQWLREWLVNYIQPTSKIRTYVRYGQIIQNHLIPELGEYDLLELSPFILQCYITKILKNGNLKTSGGLSPNTVNCIITIIQNSLKIAYSLSYMPVYFGDKIKRPMIKEKQISCFTIQEQRLIENAVFNDKRQKMFGIIICLYTGIRIGELLALEWQNVDLYEGKIYINSTSYECIDRDGKYCRVVDTPKTVSSIRLIPIPKQLLKTLRNIKRTSTSNSLIVDKRGNPISVRSYQRSFELLLKKLSIPQKNFHALRHTFATRALECGMDVKTLSEILGHKNPVVTLNRYAHSMFEHKREMMNKLGKLYT